MKLSQPFFRLPLRLDVERLQQEIAQFDESEWRSHPTGFAGNSAIRLISSGGEENDAFAGTMQPTAQLQRCPYIRQVLAHFGVAWSRSRLMRLAPGAGVPEHCDVNYHWFHRVRVHIPILTEPAVSFSCGGQTVHMGAGEGWIFDNWRQHSVHNGGKGNRVHLVADTTGNAAFWRTIGSSQSGNFDKPANSLPVFLPYREEIDARPHCERYNVMPVMPPSEVEQLTTDLLLDLKRPQNEQERGPYEHFVSLASAFCREWRTLWSLYGDSSLGWPEYSRLRDIITAELGKVPQSVICASNRMPAVDVFLPRVLFYSLYIPGDAGVVDVDRTLAPAKPSGPARSVKFKRPLFIVSAPRSGSTLLFETLARAGDLATAGGEIHGVVESLPELRPLAPGVDSNRLTAANVNEAVRAHIHEALSARLRDREGRPVDGPVRFLEKTPKNALRVGFFNELFPDAQFLFLWRDPRENLSSIMEAWRSGGWITYPELPGWDGPWSMLLPPGWQTLRGASLEQVAAFQWARTNEILLDDLSRLPQERWAALSYAEFLHDPEAMVRRICAFAGIEFDPGLAAYLSRPLPMSTHTLTPPDRDKWRVNEQEIGRVLPALEPLAARLAALPALPRAAVV